MRKLVYASFSMVLIIACLLSVGSASTVLTPVSGLITSDTTWSLANSPYQLTGPVGVASGVTLTIQPGVTVDLVNFDIQVNGTIIAKGTGDQKITFNSNSQDADIGIATNSTSWDELTGTGCIIQNAIINANLGIGKAAPKIDSNTITGHYLLTSGSPIISNNIINEEIHVLDGTPIITGNTINSFIVGSCKGPVTISNNIITGHFGDAINGAGISCSTNNIITGNIITHFKKGIVLFCGNSTIERNVIVDNTIGIQLGLFGSGTYGVFQVTIQNNLITDNAKGISLTDLSQTLGAGGSLAFTINNNNIQGNRDYNIYLGINTPINASYNWWGTADQQAINQTIYDVKNNYNLGTVTFTPYLSELDPATPIYNGQTQTATPTASATPVPVIAETENPTEPPATTTQDPATTTPTQHPEQPITQNNQQLTLGWSEIAVLIVCVIAGTLTVALILPRRKHKTQQ
jgi:hypothetical protein